MVKEAGFSWVEAKKYAVAVKIRRAMTMAKNANNPTFKLEHPDWVRDAQKNDFTLLKKQVKEKTEKYQQLAQARRDKRSGKDKNN